MIVQVPLKLRDYLFVAGQRTRTQTMDIGTKVRTAIEAGDSRMTTLTNIIIEMAAEKKQILNIVQEQQAALIELSAHFTCIAHACAWRGKEEEEAEDETLN